MSNQLCRFLDEFYRFTERSATRCCEDVFNIYINRTKKNTNDINIFINIFQNIDQYFRNL